MTTLYLDRLIKLEGAIKADAMALGDGRWRILFWFKGGKQREITTAICNLRHKEPSNEQ